MDGAPVDMRTFDPRPLLRYRPAICKTGFAASRRKMIVHRVTWLKTTVTDGKLCCHAGWVCGGYSAEAVIIADPEPFGGICKRCEAMGWIVYRCYNADGVLLYIGSTKNKRSRYNLHAKRSSWWPEAVDIRETPYPSEDPARISEGLAICAEKPVHNKQPGNRRSVQVAAA